LSHLKIWSGYGPETRFDTFRALTVKYYMYSMVVGMYTYNNNKLIFESRNHTFETVDWSLERVPDTLVVRLTAKRSRRTCRTRRMLVGGWCKSRFYQFARYALAYWQCAWPNSCPGLWLPRRKTVSAGRSTAGRRARLSYVHHRITPTGLCPGIRACPTQWSYSRRELSTRFWSCGDPFLNSPKNTDTIVIHRVIRLYCNRWAAEPPQQA